MLEVIPSLAAVVSCLGRPDVLDTIPVPDYAVPCRVAPDELLLVGPASRATELAEQADVYLSRADLDSLAIDQSDGWAGWTLAGDESVKAFARLSSIPLPESRPAFIQGAVAGVQGKVLAGCDRLDVLVISTAAHHVFRRIFAGCRDLEPVERNGREFAASQQERA